jgi:hypothetical protein
MTKITLNKNAKFVIVSVLLLVGLVCGYIYLIFGFDHFFEPGDIKINFEDDKKITLNFRVLKECTHVIGIGFVSKKTAYGHEGHVHIKDFFGGLLELNLPAEIDIKLLNTNNDIIFQRNNFGGSKIGFQYGPNPVEFIAGRVYLTPGHYNVELRIVRRHKNFQEFEAFFFAAIPPGTICGKPQKMLGD